MTLEEYVNKHFQSESKSFVKGFIYSVINQYAAIYYSQHVMPEYKIHSCDCFECQSNINIWKITSEDNMMNDIMLNVCIDDFIGVPMIERRLKTNIETSQDIAKFKKSNYDKNNLNEIQKIFAPLFVISPSEDAMHLYKNGKNKSAKLIEECDAIVRSDRMHKLHIKIPLINRCTCDIDTLILKGCQCKNQI